MRRVVDADGGAEGGAALVEPVDDHRRRRHPQTLNIGGAGERDGRAVTGLRDAIAHIPFDRPEAVGRVRPGQIGEGDGPRGARRLRAAHLQRRRSVRGDGRDGVRRR